MRRMANVKSCDRLSDGKHRNRLEVLFRLEDSHIYAFCALLILTLFSRAYQTLPRRLPDSFGCTKYCVNVLTDLLN